MMLEGFTALSVEISTNIFTPKRFDRLGHVPGAHHVVQHRLARVVLHERHMLVGGGVEDDLRPVPLEELLHHVAVADVGDDLDDVLEGLPDLAGDLVEAVFVLVQEDQAGTAETGGAAGPARTRLSRRRR